MNTKQLKKDKKALRSKQRQLQAEQRRTDQNEIMSASRRDKQLFFKLVRKQRGSSTATDHMIFNDEPVSGDKLMDAWRTYFSNLAIPKNNPDFDTAHKESVESSIKSIQQIFRRNKDCSQIPDIDQNAVQKNVAKLKNNKACDAYGITGEHLKYAGCTVIPLLTELLQQVVRSCLLPAGFKNGIVTPVYKNKKFMKNPDNYRRITVTSVVGKVLEKILVEPIKDILVNKLNKLQREFCSKSSSVNTAFLVSEAISEARDNKQILYTAMLDSSKAFDVVWHDGMLFNLYQLGIKGDLWLLYQDMYNNMTSQIKWNKYLTESFVEKQGVRQGGIPSTELFKTRGDKLLRNLETTHLGFRIGTVGVAAPACVDDIILLSSSAINLQAMLDIAADDASQEIYQYSATKTTTMVMNTRKPVNTWAEGEWWKLSQYRLNISRQEKHLGLIREPICSATATISENIKKSRRCVYSLMGSGMHGLNGLHPEISVWT